MNWIFRRYSVMLRCSGCQYFGIQIPFPSQLLIISRGKKCSGNMKSLCHPHGTMMELGTWTPCSPARDCSSLGAGGRWNQWTPTKGHLTVPRAYPSLNEWDGYRTPPSARMLMLGWGGGCVCACTCILQHRSRGGPSDSPVNCTSAWHKNTLSILYWWRGERHKHFNMAANLKIT